MKPSTRQAIANLLSALAVEFGAAVPESTAAQPEAAATVVKPPVKTQKVKAAAAAAAETPAASEAEEPVTTETQAPANGAKSYDDLRAIIEPFVKEGRGEEVKKIIAKYSAGGLKTMEAKHHAAFEKDIQALGY